MFKKYYLYQKFKSTIMAKVLIIGAGGVSQVVTFKCAQYPEVFSDIMLASRTKSKCDKIAAIIEENLVEKFRLPKLTPKMFLH